MNKYLTIFSLSIAFLACSCVRLKFGIDLSQVQRVDILEIKSGKNWQLDRQQAQPLLNQIERAEPRKTHNLPVEIKYEIKLIFIDKTVATFSAGDPIIVFDTNKEFYWFTEGFNIQNFLKPFVAA